MRATATIKPYSEQHHYTTGRDRKPTAPAPLRQYFRPPIVGQRFQTKADRAYFAFLTQSVVFVKIPVV